MLHLHFVQKTGIKMRDAELEQMMDELDPDGSGEVNYKLVVLSFCFNEHDPCIHLFIRYALQSQGDKTFYFRSS